MLICPYYVHLITYVALLLEVLKTQVCINWNMYLMYSSHSLAAVGVVVSSFSSIEMAFS